MPTTPTPPTLFRQPLIGLLSTATAPPVSHQHLTARSLFLISSADLSPLQELAGRGCGHLCETLTSHFQIDLRCFVICFWRGECQINLSGVGNTICTKLLAFFFKYEMCWNINHKSLSAANHNQALKKHAEWRGEILHFLTGCVLIKRKETITLIQRRAAASSSDGGAGDFWCWKDAWVKRICICFLDGFLMTGCDYCKLSHLSRLKRLR